MGKTNMFSKDLVFLDFECQSSEEFMTEIGMFLEKKGYVKGGFKEALIKREKRYPTGLPSEPYAVAIPHCDPIYINQEKIVCIRFKQTVEFKEMGTTESKRDVKFAFVLLIKEKKQVSVLQTLMPIFMDENFMNELIVCNSNYDFAKKMEEKYYEE